MTTKRELVKQYDSEGETPCTCQICGRAIKANTGKIAHHGYKRPDQGFQTSSCPGARHLPYEQSCDAIQPVIDGNRIRIEKTQAAIVELKANPPVQLRCEKYAGAWKRPTIVMVDRPVDFNVEAALRSGANRMYSYEALYSDEIRKREQAIKEWQAGIEYLQKRLDNWKAPVEVASKTIACAAQPAPSITADIRETDEMPIIDETVILSELPSTSNSNNNRTALREIELGEWDAPLPADELAIAVDRIDELMTRNAELETLRARVIALVTAYDYWNSRRGDFNREIEMGDAINAVRELIAER